jgi:MarR family transcriptional regulator, organic hydroperoxide resistance regulator
MESQSIISLIGKIRREANQFLIDSLKSRGFGKLSPSHGDILALLGDGGSLPMKEIASLINRKKNTVTVLVEKLIQLGYVRKIPSSNDSRVMLVSLTRKGKQLMPDFKEISRQLMETTYTGLSDRDQKQMLKLLIKVWDNFCRVNKLETSEKNRTKIDIRDN